MEKDILIQFENKCIQEEQPYCQAACPIHLDARALCASWAGQDAAAARKILERTMPLPALTAYLCEAPCEEHCLRTGFSGPLSLGRLERAAVNLAPRQGRLMPIPPKPGRVAVLGAGAAGLAAAWDLAKKGWQVELFGQAKAGYVLGGYERPFPREVLDQELKDLASLGAKARSQPELGRGLLAQLAQSHEGVLLDCLAWDARSLGLDPEAADPLTLCMDQGSLFAAGVSSLQGRASYIEDLCQGRRAAVSLDRLLQKVSLSAQRQGEGPQPTRLVTDTKGTPHQPRIIPQDARAGYTAEEAAQEAGRCLRCQCMQCVQNCAYLQAFGGYPKAYARQAYNNEAIVKGSREANLLVNSCSLCGQCEQICPNGFSMADLCLGARRRMAEQGHMPPSAHYFALQEMDSAWEPRAYLARHAPGLETSTWLFFPGCQLSGLRPGQVTAVYDHLQSSLEGGVALMLACCGAPAHWAGRREQFSGVLDRIITDWKRLDCPRIITGCTSCLAMFRQNLPEMAAVSLWELWLQKGAPPPAKPQGELPPLAVEDPCTTRLDPAIQNAVRQLLQQAGRPLEEMGMSGRLTECCGYGGLMAGANPQLAEQVIEQRAGQSRRDYLTYCAMCRDRLAHGGKRAMHMLDIYFPPSEGDPAEHPPAGLSRRWENRGRLADELLQSLWGRAGKPRQPWSGVSLKLSPEVSALMDQRRILEDDLRQVLHQAAGRGFQDQQSGRQLVSASLGPVTYWVEYTPENGDHVVHRTWTHRMAAGRAKL